MQEIIKLNNDNIEYLFNDIKNLCTDDAYAVFLTLLDFLREDPTDENWVINVGYTSSVLEEDNTQYPVYILRFVKNEEHYLVFYVDDDNVIFTVKHFNSINEDKIKFN